MLAKAISKIFTEKPGSYVGSADHLVSQAFYFEDPDQNGVELYFDRPRSEWEYDEDGKIIMGTERLDEEEFISDNINTEEANAGYIRDGHFHLKGGSINEAKKFYSDSLIFEIKSEMPSALFISRDGYHHHIAINTWESLGAGKRTPNTVGMKSFTINYKDKKIFNQVLENLQKNNFKTTEITDSKFSAEDPWGSLVYIKYSES